MILDGHLLPPRRPDADDNPRNILFELATARVLKAHGFGIRFPPQDGEDIEVTYPGLGVFSVECKRPAHLGSLANNLKLVIRQLRKRNLDGQRTGLAMIGVDRMLGVGPSNHLGLKRASDLPSALKAMHGGQIENVKTALR
jgi:hypothetical protein